MTFDATLITPCAPNAIKGKVSESSPLKITNLRAKASAKLADPVGNPPASLMPTIFLKSLRQPGSCIDADFNPAATRNTVKHDWESSMTCNLPKMLKQTFLSRLIVVRRDLKRTISSNFLSLFRQIDGFARRIAASTRKHFNLPRCKSNRERNDMNVLLIIDGRRFAGSSNGDDPIDSGLDLVLTIKRSSAISSTLPSRKGVTIAV